MIRVRGLRKCYPCPGKPVEVLRGFDFDAAAGQFAAIVGRSGSGKSTLLHLLAGLDVPTSGDVVIDGHALSGMSDDARTAFRRRRIGVVHQFFNLLPMLS